MVVVVVVGDWLEYVFKHFVAKCCKVLHAVAICCMLLQYVAVAKCNNMLQHVSI